MYHAVENDLEKVMTIFKQNKKWFPHVRSFHIKTRIGRKQVILEDGVVITYHYYTRKQPLSKLDKDGKEIGPMFIKIIAEKGDCILHQIVTSERGKASIVLQKFFNFVQSSRVYLSVRSNNDVAIKFYLKNDMKLVGNTHWSGGKMPGDIYLYENNSYNPPKPPTLKQFLV
tara:strand:- start:269 stop:781 length:513 start_codon:yes stop_codon:yes gene_type:complete